MIALSVACLAAGALAGSWLARPAPPPAPATVPQLKLDIRLPIPPP
ncbi:MAG: hypothetical protein N2690_09645 [Rhodocyclaceae bacterium]|nr:hypothetical protein [Rhodocyclaceae bacterium]